MKKILSVMLAVLMLFGALSVSASAVTQITNDKNIIFNNTYEGISINSSLHTIVVLDFNGGTAGEPLNVYDTDVGGFTEVESFTGKYIMLPGSSTDCFLTAGSTIKLPYVKAPDGYETRGWYCKANGEYYVVGAEVEIPNNWIGDKVTFQASYYPSEMEGDTLKTILGVLTKVFGTVLGILFLDGSSTAGIELVNKLLAGIM